MLRQRCQYAGSRESLVALRSFSHEKLSQRILLFNLARQMGSLKYGHAYSQLNICCEHLLGHADTR